jgi:PAS domain S-box-containing protein
VKAPGRLWLLYWPAALVAGGVAFALVVTSNHEDRPLLTGFLGLLAGWSFIGSGLVARARAPQNTVGRLMVAVGFAFFAGSLGWANGSVPFTIGLAVGSFWAAILVHLLLAYPSGTLPGRAERITVRAGYVLAGLGPLLTLLFDPKPVSLKHAPPNAALITDNHAANVALNLLVDVLAVLVLGAVIVLVLRRWHAATAPERRVLAPVLLSGFVASAFLVADIVVGAISQHWARPLDLLLVAAFASVPLFFLLGLLQTRLARAGVGRLLVEVPEAPTREQTQDALRRTLRDPTLQLAYWLPERRGYVDVDGEPFELPSAGGDRVATTVEDLHGPIAALVHDRAVLAEPQLLDEVVAAARLGLAKDRSLRALEASEQRVRALLGAIPDNMYRVARDGTYLDFNAHVPEDLVAPPDLIVGDRIQNVLPKEVADILMAGIERALETCEVVSVEYRVQRTRGLRDTESRIVNSGEDEVVIIVRDITERKAAEAELERLGRELAERLDELQRERDFISAVLDTAPALVCVYDRDGRIVAFNRECERLTGYTYEDVRGRRIDELLVPPEEAERTRRAIMAVFDGDVPNQNENHWITRDGERRLVLWTNAIIPDESGQPAFGIGAGADVTERRRAEEELRRQSEFTRTVVNVAPSFFVVLNLDGRVMRFNRTLELASGVDDDEEARRRHFAELFAAPEDAETLRAAVDAATRGEGKLDGAYGFPAADGATRIVEWWSTPVVDESGRERVLVCGLDVTERRRQEEELRRQRDFLSLVAGATPTLMCNVDADGKITAEGVNRAFAASIGYDDPDATGRDLAELVVPPEERDEVRRALADVAAGGPVVERENTWIARDGRRLLVAWSSRPLAEEPRTYLVAATDVTQRKQQEEELRASRARIVEAGDAERRRLERNLHDGAQQRLVSLSLALRLAQSKLEDDPDAAAQLLEGATGELSQALAELRELARGIHPAILTDRGLEPALESLVGRTPVPVEVATSLDGERLPPPVEAAAFYVVSEALANVAKYAHARSVAVRVSRSNGSAVVEVADDGVGGADPRRGSGLRGLADRVEALEGRLGIESRPGEGTTIRAEIPCA